jgi:hypothetical protein
MAPKKETDSERYGLKAHYALACAFMALLDKNGLLNTSIDGNTQKYPPGTKEEILGCLNSACIPGDEFTWDGVRKASIYLLSRFDLLFLIYCFLHLRRLSFCLHALPPRSFTFLPALTP